MREFRSNPGVVFKNVMYTLAGTALLGIILTLLSNVQVALIVITPVALLVLFVTVWYNNLCICVSATELSVYRGSHLLQSFSRKQCRFSAHCRTGGSNPSLTFTVWNDDFHKKSFDCSMMGTDTFYELLETMDMENEKLARARKATLLKAAG